MIIIVMLIIRIIIFIIILIIILIILIIIIIIIIIIYTYANSNPAFYITHICKLQHIYACIRSVTFCKIHFVKGVYL